jgi:hypothetical protein
MILVVFTNADEGEWSGSYERADRQEPGSLHYSANSCPTSAEWHKFPAITYTT